MRRVVYLMSGPGFMPYLITSLKTLRVHWRAEVHVHAWDESIEIARRIAEDERLGVTAISREPRWRGKNSQFADKILLMMEQTDVHSALYLDADTLVSGKLFPLLELAEVKSFVGTQFCNWKTNGGIISGRIRRLRDFPEIDQDLVDEVLDNPYPSPNGGIFACTHYSPVLPLWHRWTMIACGNPPLGAFNWRRGIFIADETVLQILPLKMPERITIAKDGTYNMSPKEKYRANVPDEYVRVWHGHGNCFGRPSDKSPEGHAMWLRHWRECLDVNLGGCREWAEHCLRQNKHLSRLEGLCTAS